MGSRNKQKDIHMNTSVYLECIINYNATVLKVHVLVIPTNGKVKFRYPKSNSF